MNTESPWRQVILTLVILGAAAWAETPEWQRKAVMAKARHRLRKLIGFAALRAGHLAMGHELAGNQPGAETGYEVTLRLSRLRDRL